MDKRMIRISIIQLFSKHRSDFFTAIISVKEVCLMKNRRVDVYDNGNIWVVRLKRGQNWCSRSRVS